MNARQQLREQTVKALAELVEEDPEVVKAEFARLDEERRFVDSLIDARHASGLSHVELAALSGLAPEKIGEMESGTDAALSVADVQAYLGGLGKTLAVARRPARSRPRRRPTPAMA